MLRIWPFGFLLSRTAPTLASSTHAPPLPPLRLDLRQMAADCSGVMVHPFHRLPSQIVSHCSDQPR